MSGKRTGLWVIAAAVAVAAALALAGCGGAGSSGGGYGGYGGSATGGGASGGSTSLRVLQPTDGGTVKAGDVEVKVEVTNLKLVPPGGAPVAGEGHIHYTLDGTLVMKPATTVVFPGVAKGEHTLTVELVQNDHTSFAPAVIQTVKFTAQ